MMKVLGMLIMMLLQKTLVDGQSIDNTIDTLISNHDSDADAAEIKED